MPRPLDRDAMRAWIAGQEAASKVVRSERVRLLLSLSPERSRELYLAIAEARRRGPDERPSPVLLAMRRAVARLEGGDKR